MKTTALFRTFSQKYTKKCTKNKKKKIFLGRLVKLLIFWGLKLTTKDQFIFGVIKTKFLFFVQLLLMELLEIMSFFCLINMKISILIFLKILGY